MCAYINSENCLIGSDGFLKVADFGFSCELGLEAYAKRGTREYMAPEILFDFAPPINPREDPYLASTFKAQDMVKINQAQACVNSSEQSSSYSSTSSSNESQPRLEGKETKSPTQMPEADAMDTTMTTPQANTATNTNTNTNPNTNTRTTSTTKKANSPANDLWSVGCVLCEIFVGVPPWSTLVNKDKQDKTIDNALRRRQLPPEFGLLKTAINTGTNADSFHSLISLLERCFDFDPIKRINAQELLNELEKIAIGAFVPQDRNSMDEKGGKEGKEESTSSSLSSSSSSSSSTSFSSSSTSSSKQREIIAWLACHQGQAETHSNNALVRDRVLPPPSFVPTATSFSVDMARQFDTINLKN